jgi:hypothetical protein
MMRIRAAAASRVTRTLDLLLAGHMSHMSTERMAVIHQALDQPVSRLPGRPVRRRGQPDAARAQPVPVISRARQ